MQKYIYLIELYFNFVYLIPFMFSLIGIYFGIKFAKDKYVEVSAKIVFQLFVVLFIVSSGYFTYKIAEKEISLEKYKKVNKFKTNLTIQNNLVEMTKDGKISEFEYLKVQDKILELENEISLSENNKTIIEKNKIDLLKIKEEL